jgi:hypothetical protein
VCVMHACKRPSLIRPMTWWRVIDDVSSVTLTLILTYVHFTLYDCSQATYDVIYLSANI